VKSREKDPVLNRLKRIEGQVRGLARMIEQERPCADILTQVSSVEQALGAVTKILLKNHLRGCVAVTSSQPDAAENDARYEELAGLLTRHWR